MWNPFKRFKNAEYWREQYEELLSDLNFAKAEANFYRTQAEAQAKIIKAKYEEIEILEGLHHRRNDQDERKFLGQQRKQNNRKKRGARRGKTNS